MGLVEVPRGEPRVDTVEDLAARLAPYDVVVAIGGGSVLDSAKLAARLRDEPDRLPAKLLGAEPIREGGAAVVAVPTTSGSGAEVTRTAVVSHLGRKSWAWDERLRPDRALLCSDLAATTPPQVALAAGLDAFAHAVEAGTGRRATPQVSALGFEAAREVREHLADSLGARREARTAMMVAATGAGCAIDMAGTGIGHAVGHALGSLMTIPHGLAVMAGLRAGVGWTVEGAPDRFTGLAESLGCTIEGLPEVVDDFCEEVGFTDALARWTPPTVDELAEEMLHPDHLPMRQNNARPIEDVLVVARLVVGGWPA